MTTGILRILDRPRAARRHRPRDRSRQEPRHPHQLDRGDDRRRDQLHPDDADVGRAVRRPRPRRRRQHPRRLRWRRSSAPLPPACCRWRSPARASTPPTRAAPSTCTTRSRWPAPWPSCTTACRCGRCRRRPARRRRRRCTSCTRSRQGRPRLPVLDPPAGGGAHQAPAPHGRLRRVAEAHESHEQRPVSHETGRLLPHPASRHLTL